MKKEAKTNAVADEGWGWPGNSKKAHYFNVAGERKDPQEAGVTLTAGPDDCAACVKAVNRRKAT